MFFKLSQSAISRCFHWMMEGAQAVSHLKCHPKDVILVKYSNEVYKNYVCSCLFTVENSCCFSVYFLKVISLLLCSNIIHNIHSQWTDPGTSYVRLAKSISTLFNTSGKNTSCKCKNSWGSFLRFAKIWSVNRSQFTCVSLHWAFR